MTLALRLPMELVVERNHSALYTLAADGRVGNAFTLHIENRARAAERFHLRLESDPPGFELVAGLNPIPLPETSIATASVFVMAPMGAARAAELRFLLEPELRASRPLIRDARFIAPEAGGPGGG